nr:MAG TPA: capsid protein [Caudoviricetes sp.]
MAKFMQFDMNVKNVFENDESNYDSFNKLMLDYSHDMLDGISAREANDKIVEIFRNIIGCDEKSTKAEIRRGIRRNQNLIFDLIEVVIDDALISGWQENPFFKEFVEVRNLAMHDKNEFYVPDDSVLSVMKVSGNHHDLLRQRLGAGKTFSVETSWYGIKVYAEFERLLTGLEDFSTLVGKITEAFDRYVNQALYETLIGIGTTLGSQWYKASAINDTTKETLRTLVMDVSMATGSEVVIMGTYAALSKVYDLTNVSWASGDMKNEKYTTGRFGYWEGIRLVELKQGFKLNDTTQYLIANDVLFIMPVGIEPMIKLVYEGDTQTYQVQDAGTHMD